MVAFAFPVAIELYLAKSSRRIAELLYSAHCSWEAVNEYVDLYGEWAKKVLSPHHQNVLDDERNRMKVIAIIGAVGNVCGCYANGFKEDYKVVLTQMIKLVSTVIELPVFDVGSLVSKLTSVVESGDLVVCGHRISADDLRCAEETADRSDKD